MDVENGGDGNAGGTMYFIPPECHHVSNPAFVDERGRTEHVKALTQVIENDGGEVLYGHDLVKLVQDADGAVTGAVFNTDAGYVSGTPPGLPRRRTPSAAGSRRTSVPRADGRHRRAR